MTSSAAAAIELARALSPSEQQFSLLKEYADFCGIPAIVRNRLTRLELDMSMLFTRTNEVLSGFLKSISELEMDFKKHALYR